MACLQTAYRVKFCSAPTLGIFFTQLEWYIVQYIGSTYRIKTSFKIVKNIYQVGLKNALLLFLLLLGDT